MIAAEFQPTAHFTGFINHIQGKIDSYLTISSGSLYQNQQMHNPQNAFNYDSTTHAAATDRTEKWISFSFKNNYFYVTHYELQQRSETTDHLMKNWSFEAKNDLGEWMKLDTSFQDKDFDECGDQKLFPCKKGIYQHFRIHEEEQEILTLKRIDIYGIFCNTKDVCMRYIYKFNSKCQTLDIHLTIMNILVFIII